MRTSMKTFQSMTITAAVFTLATAGVNAQTAPATSNPLPAAVASAQTLVVNELGTLKTTVTQYNTDKAAGVPLKSDIAAIQAARTQLQTDQKTLDAAAKTFLSADQLAVKTDLTQLKTDTPANWSALRNVFAAA